MRHGRKCVLSDVNLRVRPGEFLLLSGPNGGGKTTLLRIILGLLRPVEGTVTISRKDFRTGYLPQKSSIDSSYPITVREVIASGLLASSFSRGETAAKVGRMLELVELTAHASKPIGALSGGQQQRALLARAIISQPQLLVLDEPLSYVDARFAEKIYGIIRNLSRTTTIIMVSHELSPFRALATQSLLVDKTVSPLQE